MRPMLPEELGYPEPDQLIKVEPRTLVWRQTLPDGIPAVVKLYRRRVINGVRPLLSHHFNLTVELPLKAIVRGFRFEVLPNVWTNRMAGESKLKIKEMGSRYLFIVLYCLLEKWLSRGDYLRQSKPPP